MKIKNLNNVNILHQLIALYHNTLLFYSDEENYKKNLVNVDGGYQAKFTIKTIEDIIETHNDAENDYNIQSEILKNMPDDNASYMGLNDVLNDFKNLEELTKEIKNKLKNEENE